MPVISVRIPQMGEGLQEALLVEFLKNPGDKITRDEPIYVMETDKATTDVESPYDGTLVEWTAEPGTVLAIGTEIAKMEVAEGTQEMAAGHGPPADEPAASPAPAPAPAASTSSKPATETSTGVKIPPRTRKYLKEKGLMDVAASIPAAGNKLMPEDVDKFIAEGGTASAGGSSETDSDLFDKVELPTHQITLNYRLSRSAASTIPVTVQNEVRWEALGNARSEIKKSGNPGPTGFVMSLWCVLEAMKKHPKIRSTISSDGRHLQQYKEINLGIAVSLPGDLMVTAVVRGADKMDRAAFFEACVKQIEIARDGKDQADATTTLTVSNIGKAGMRMGIPAIVAPAVATLAIGESYLQPVPNDAGSVDFKQACTITMTFDHRILNGVGAANFMNDVKSEIENFTL